MTDSYGWFVPAWILGAPFLLMIVEAFRASRHVR
jgi:hypothetical protein